jgi:hypothetical protein
MKVGDLVEYIESDMGGSVTVEGQEGLIIGGPREQTESGRLRTRTRRWEVFWMYCNKTGWWDEFQLGVIDEARSN